MDFGHASNPHDVTAADIGEKKKMDLGEIISFECRTVEIPNSEYKELIGMKAKLDSVIEFAACHDGYDTREFFKNVFHGEIMNVKTVMVVKEEE